MLIRISNTINRQVSNIVNNRFSNWLKEVFNIGMDYPLYLYCDATEEFLNKFDKEYQQKSWIKRIVSGNKRIDATLTLTNLPKYGIDFRKKWSFQRNKILKDVNKFFNGEKIFRFRGIMTVESKIGTGETNILP